VFKDLKAVASQTTVVELALAIVLAQAIASLASSMLDDILLPPIGLLIGGRSVPSLFWNLTPQKTLPSGPIDSIEKAHYAGASVIAYGVFIEHILQLCLLCFFARLTLKWISHVRAHNAAKEKGEWPPAPNDADVSPSEA
jgi:large conductance mechanosensitive channel